jgi:DNA-binding HxlR family transcriptional regulator
MRRAAVIGVGPPAAYSLTPMGRVVAGQLAALIEHVKSLVPGVERTRAGYGRR